MTLTDQVTKVVAKLESDKYPFDRDELVLAARLIATLAAEVDNKRAVCAGETAPCHQLFEVEAATDALLAEVGKEKTNGQV